MLLDERIAFFPAQAAPFRFTIRRLGPLDLLFRLFLVAIRLFPLAARTAGAVKVPDGVPIQIAVEINAPVAGDEDARAERAEGVGDFLDERAVARGGALHSIEEPFPAEDIERGLEPVGHRLEMRQRFATPVALRQRRAADDARRVPECEPL